VGMTWRVGHHLLQKKKKASYGAGVGVIRWFNVLNGSSLADHSLPLQGVEYRKWAKERAKEWEHRWVPWCGGLTEGHKWVLQWQFDRGTQPRDNSLTHN
jgi:hypothetical protein